MNAQQEIEKLLVEHNITPERQTGGHKVYRLPNRRVYTISATPSDVRAYMNALADLRRMLGVKCEIVKNPNRREKCPPPPQQYRGEYIPPKMDLRQQLMSMMG